MVLNLNLLDLSSSIKNNYLGVFTGEINTSINTNRTKSTYKLLDKEKRLMDNDKLIEDFRSLLKSRYSNDLDLFAKEYGVPVQEVYDFVAGISNPLHGVINELLQQADKKSENVVLGDKIEGDKFEIKTWGGTTNNNFADKETIKQQKVEITDLKKFLKEKDATIKALIDEIELLKKR